MGTVLILKDGRREFITDDRDFAELIYRELGLDAYEYIQDMSDSAVEEIQAKMYENPLEYCPGECDKVFETQRHYTDILQEIEDDLREIYKEHYQLKRPHKLYLITDLIGKVVKNR